MENLEQDKNETIVQERETDQMITKKKNHELGMMLVDTMSSSLLFLLSKTCQFVIFDCEHGKWTRDSLAKWLPVCRGFGLTSVVRVPCFSYEWFGPVLDQGADVLMIPRVTCFDEIRQILSFVRYPPFGQRGVVSSRGLTDFEALPPGQFTPSKPVKLWIQVENLSIFGCLEEIAQISELDALFFGPADMSASLEAHKHLPSDQMPKWLIQSAAAGLDISSVSSLYSTQPPLLAHCLIRMIEICKAHGIRAALQVPNRHKALQALDLITTHMGYRNTLILSVGCELSLMRDLLHDLSETLSQ